MTITELRGSRRHRAETHTRARSFRARVATIVLNHDTVDETLAAVESIMASTYLDQHLIVVDNGSDVHALRRLGSELPETASLIVDTENNGYAAGNNLGIRHALDNGAEHVVLLNPDARLLRGTIDGLVAAADRIPDAGIIGPRLLHGGSRPVTVQSDGGHVDWARGGATRHVGAGRLHEPGKDGVHHVDYVTGACVLLRARMLEDIGLIPEQYFLYYEETALALDAHRAGWAAVVDRDNAAWHYRLSTSHLPSRCYVYYMVRNRALFAKQYMGGDGVVETAFDDLDRTFLDPWAQKISVRAPELLPVYNEVVALAKKDGKSGVAGRNDNLSKFMIEGVHGWS